MKSNLEKLKILTWQPIHFEDLCNPCRRMTSMLYLLVFCA